MALSVQRAVLMLRDEFGFSNAAIDICKEYEDLTTNTSCCRAAHFLLHLQVCANIQNGYPSSELIMLEGMFHADARKEMVHYGVTGSTPDLLWVINGEVKTIEVTVTSMAQEMAYRNKRNKSIEHGREYNIIIVVQELAGEVFCYGDPFCIPDEYRQIIKAQTLQFSRVLARCFDEVTIEEARRPNVHWKDLDNKADELAQYEDLGPINYAAMTNAAHKIKLEPCRDLPVPPESTERTYFRTIVPISCAGFPTNDPLNYRDLKVGSHFFTPAHCQLNIDLGFPSTPAERRMRRQIVRNIILELLTEMREVEADQPYVLTSTSDAEIAFGRGAKPDKTGTDLHFSMKKDSKKLAPVPVGDIVDFWLSKPTVAADPDDPYQVEEGEVLDDMQQLSEDIADKWRDTMGFRIQYITRKTHEDFISYSGHKETSPSSVKVFPMSMRITETQHHAFGLLFTQQTHFVSKGPPKNPRVIVATWEPGHNIPEGLWNCHMFHAAKNGVPGILCVKFTMYNVAKWTNAMFMDRLDSLAQARITADAAALQNISEKPVEITDAVRATLLRNESRLYYVWNLLQVTLKESLDEGLLPVARARHKCRIARMYGKWNGWVFSNEKLQKKMKGFDRTPLSHFYISMANGDNRLPYDPYPETNILSTIPGYFE